MIKAEAIWGDFISMISKRMEAIDSKYPQYVLSEETFRLDLAIALSSRLNVESEVFAEFPCDDSPSQKWDIFITREPGTAIEIKFLRPIPSGRNPPFTQHYGAVLSDIIKLHTFSYPKRDLYFVLIADQRFSNHLNNQGIPIWHEGVNKTLSIHSDVLQKTAIKEIEKRLGKGIIDEKVDIHLTLVENDLINNFTANLYKISVI